MQIFNKLDTELKGYIDELDIYKFCRTYKIIMEVEDTKMIVKLLDLDHDGYIRVNEYDILIN
jgi:Ca2+-binding EF-hand superfamily protein